MTRRRNLLSTLPLIGAALGTQSVLAQTRRPAPAKAERFPGDPPEHKLVYQFNQASDDYMSHVLTSIGAMIGRYADNIGIAVVAFGPGIHLLAKSPQRPVSEELRDRARSQAKAYGVRFIACGNTMKSYDWTAKDMLDFAQVEEVGAAALMELQEQGYAYLAW